MMIRNRHFNKAVPFLDRYGASTRNEIDPTMLITINPRKRLSIAGAIADRFKHLVNI